MTFLSKSEKFCGLLGLLYFLLMSFPLLQIFNRDTLVGGIPLLALYIFGVWILATAGLYAISRWLTCQGQPDQKESKR